MPVTPSRCRGETIRPVIIADSTSALGSSLRAVRSAWRGFATATAESLSVEAESLFAAISRDAARGRPGQAIAAPDSIDLAVALALKTSSRLGCRRWREPGTSEAIARAIDIRTRRPLSDRLDLSDALVTQGRLQRRQGRLTQARDSYAVGLSIAEFEAGPGDPRVGGLVGNLGGIQQELGDFLQARISYERCLAVFTASQGPDGPDVAGALYNLGFLALESGDYAAARTQLTQSLAIRERAEGPAGVHVANCLHNLARIQCELGDYAEALPPAERALAIRETSGDSEPLGNEVAQSLTLVANINWELGDTARSRALFEKALARVESHLGADHPKLATYLNNAASADLSAGDLDAARTRYRRLLGLVERTSGPGSPQMTLALDGLAHVARASGDLDQAGSLLERSLRITTAVYGPSHPLVSECLIALSPVRQAEGRGVEALDLALRAEEIGRDHFRLAIRSLSEREALRYAAVRASGLGAAADVIAHGATVLETGRLWDAVIASRALVLDEMAARHEVRTGDSLVVDSLRAELSSATERLARQIVLGPESTVGQEDAPYPASLQRLRRERERVEQNLAAVSSEFRRTQDREAAGLRDVSAALPPRSALVAYLRYHGEGRPSYLALVLPAPGSDPVAVPLGSAAAVDDLVARWRRQAGQDPRSSRDLNPEAACREAGERLRHAIWDPVAALIGEAGRIFVVPDGTLHAVSLTALPAAGSPDEVTRYLVETGLLAHTLTSEKDLLTRSPERRGEGLLAVGGVAFDAQPAVGQRATGFRGAGPDCPVFRQVRFPLLPASREEAEALARVWPGGTGDALVLPGPEATEARVKSLAPGKRVLHLATHGFVVDPRCVPGARGTDRGIGGTAPALDVSTADSTDATTTVSNATSAATSAVSSTTVADAASGRIMSANGQAPSGKPPGFEDSMLSAHVLQLSGLALAGANHRNDAEPGEEDGILTAEEIANLDLHGTEWAVLSACDTGLGEVSPGEGCWVSAGLSCWPAAHSVIFSLWSVRDQDARDWMALLYQSRFGEGLDTAASVRNAARALLLERRAAGLDTHPFHWGGFTAAGDWR